MSVGIRLTQKEFLEKLWVNNEYYRNGEFEVLGDFVNYSAKILLKDKYGFLKTHPSTLLEGGKASIQNSLDKNEYCKNQFIEAHGYKYDYSLINYTTSSKKVKIICKTHGIYEQSHNKHFSGKHGCPECCSKEAIQKRVNGFKSSYKERASETHNYFYDYSKSVYKGNSSKIDIICPLHGKFSQLLASHLSGSGCAECAYLNRGKGSLRGKNHYLQQFLKKHGDKYDYSLLPENIKSKDTIPIICPNHGEFKQTVNVHCRSGCIECGREATKRSNRKYPKEIMKPMKNIRRRLRKFIVNNKYTKEVRTDQIIGCSWLELRDYLDKNPYGFKMGDESLDVDHIIPLSFAKTQKDLYNLSHFSNLQLLPSFYNRSVKRDSVFDELDFEKWWESNKP